MNIDKEIEKDVKAENRLDGFTPTALQKTASQGKFIISTVTELLLRAWSADPDKTYAELNKVVDHCFEVATYMRKRFNDYQYKVAQEFDAKERADAAKANLILPDARILTPHHLPGTLPGVNGPMPGVDQ